MVNNYPDFYSQVTDTMAKYGQESPNTMAGFMRLHKASSTDCASRDEIVDAIGVAIMMGGAPAVVYGSQALEALEQFESEGEG